MPSDRPFDRVALVTGAARGIGAATVAALCDAGYGVTAVDVSSGNNVPPGVAYPLATPEQMAALEQRYPNQVLAVQCDVRDREAMVSVTDATLARFGRLDAAVAAAGVVVGGLPQWDTPVEHLQTLLDVNVLGVWNTAAASLRVMLSGPAPSGCRFVAIASAAGEQGLYKLTGYTTSKHAVIGIVRGLAADLVGTGVTAVAVAPGSTDTPMLAATADLYDLSPADLAKHQGIRRLIDASEIGATVAFCCSPAGAALNGSVIRADGGFTG